MMGQAPSLRRNAFALITMQAINYLVPLVTLPYLTRALGVTQFGVFNIAVSLIQYGILFVTFGFNLSVTQYIARNRNNAYLISEIFWNTIVAKLSLLLLTYIALGILVFVIDNFYSVRWLVLILFLQLFAITIDPIWFFQGTEKLTKVSLYSAVLKLLTIPLLYYLVNDPKDIYMVAIIQSIIFLFISVLNIFLVYQEKIISFQRVIFFRVKSLILESFPYFIGTISVSLYSVSTPIILGILSDYENVGIYSSSFKIQGAFLGIFTVLGQMFYPRITYLFSYNKQDGYTFVRKLLFICFPIVTVLAVVFYTTIPHIAVLLLGEEFVEIKETLRIMTPMIIVVPYAIILSNYILLPLGFKKEFYLTPFCIGLLHILYCSILSLKFGALGASWSILITDTLLLLVYVILVHKKIGFINILKGIK